MHNVHAEADYLQLVLHRDDQTPVDFVVDLVRSVFSKTTANAIEVVTIAEDQGKAVCGTYPRDVAEACFETFDSGSLRPDIHCR